MSKEVTENVPFDVQAMSESQFEKMFKALKTAECEWDLSRHTIKIQDGIISELTEENERLRELIWDVVDNARYENEEEIAVLTKDFDKMAFAIANLEKEVGDE